MMLDIAMRLLLCENVNTMVNIKLLKLFLTATCLCLTCNYAAAKTDAMELKKMESFHLKNAQNKLNKQQFSYAWGDLAYLLCQIPNHHAALKSMVQISTQLNKNAELTKYFAHALKLYPEDEVVLALYGTFLLNTGEQEKGQQFIAQALAIDPNLSQEFLARSTSDLK